MWNALTVDVEEHFHVSNFSRVIREEDWGSLESRVEWNCLKVLDLLDETGSRGTFFVLGWVAERHRGLVGEIHRRGHEVACHGYSHKLISRQTPEEFLKDVRRAKAILEDIIGEAVIGYRAPTFSL
ncbi:MAG: polysaccharide deacetylase family protein, partial [candidate division NC10 bacterium]|nr:polysaccharide deacetylase family protein [candidate division NC10 bacterium]